LIQISREKLGDQDKSILLERTHAAIVRAIKRNDNLKFARNVIRPQSRVCLRAAALLL